MNPMVRIKQGTVAYGQDSNLSVIPLGTEVMDASLPLWTVFQLLHAVAGAHAPSQAELLAQGKTGERPRVILRIRLRGNPGDP